MIIGNAVCWGFMWVSSLNVPLTGAYDQALPGGFHDFYGNDRKPISAHDALNLGHQVMNENYALIPVALLSSSH